MGKYKQIIRWSIAACCIGYIIWFFFKNTEELKIVSGLPVMPVVGMASLAVLSHIVYSWRFAIILKKCSGRSIAFITLFRIVVLGRFLSTFAPQAGTVYRSVCLKKNYGISYTSYAGSLFSITWLDTCLNLIFAGIIILAIEPKLQIANLPILYLLAITLVLILAVPLILEAIFRSIKFRNQKIAWVHSKLSELLTVSVQSLKDGKYMAKIILTGLVGFINTLVIFHFCFFSLNIQFDLPDLALFYVILKLSNHLIITPGNMGVRELAYGILSEQIHIGMAKGILISVILRIIGTLVIIALGASLGGFDLLRHRGNYIEKNEDAV